MSVQSQLARYLAKIKMAAGGMSHLPDYGGGVLDELGSALRNNPGKTAGAVGVGAGAGALLAGDSDGSEGEDEEEAELDALLDRHSHRRGVRSP